ncbi:LPXTG cell wall anchor domain-containing protein [Micromonospora cathayae]|uniref:LPXTG cell wall anchor domain-containing protein n=1 Tax=Micromonospora cathayae TaxID=3028804 RepID=A0ABY7ZTI7_9ACTN|nr:LPXTG cell wall anchor domain-containing protein [Micromonospora sp. HUAS 3]WDZ86327.1 LPXTG cell wall anchor domain-containing protein [Micromonospora sp. HUAS 3]
MIFRNRPLARFGAAALLASGVFTALGTPAYAAGTETDLSLDVAGTRIAAGASGKVAFVKVTNNGKNTPGSLAIKADLSKVDINKVVPVPVDEGPDGCDYEEDGETLKSWVCNVPAGALPGPGETLELPIVVFKAGESLEGTYQAPVSFTLISKDDTDDSNNTKDTVVELTDESGADLTVFAPDVKQAVKVDQDGLISVVGDLHAGETGQLVYVVANQGDQAVAGLKITVKLPKGTTFTEAEPGCEYNAANTEAVCTYGEFPLIPVEQDGEENDKLVSVAEFYHLLSVGKDVKAGALSGGSVTVDPILPRTELRASARELRKLPENAKALSTDDIDASDNTDGYAVIVAAKGGTGGGDGDGGSLPVTGPQAGLIGGIGGAVLIAGGVMFLMARRRRVVLVTPGDEKPTA